MPFFIINVYIYIVVCVLFLLNYNAMDYNVMDYNVMDELKYRKSNIDGISNNTQTCYATIPAESLPLVEIKMQPSRQIF